MKTTPASMWSCVALLLGSHLEASQLREPNERAIETAVLVVCPPSRASGDESLLVIELPGEAPEQATSGLLYRGEVSPNMFATPTRAPDTSACTQVGLGRVVAQSVRARVPRDGCEPDTTVVADDLVLLETSEPITPELGKDMFAVSRNGQDWNPVIARSDSYLLANAQERGSEKLLRSSRSSAVPVGIDDDAALAVGRDTTGNQLVVALADEEDRTIGTNEILDPSQAPIDRPRLTLRRFTRLVASRCMP